MMEQITGNDAIESKAIEIIESEKGSSIPMILTAFDEQDNDPLDSAGYRGRHVIFTLIDGGVQASFSDPYKADHHMVYGPVKGFMLDVRQGWGTYGREGIDWTEIEHGKTYDLYNSFVTE